MRSLQIKWHREIHYQFSTEYPPALVACQVARYKQAHAQFLQLQVDLLMFEDDGENHACNLSFPCGYFALHLSVFQIVPSDSQPALSMFSFS